MVLFAFIFSKFCPGLGEAFVVLVWWSHIVLVSDYCGRLLLLHLF
jgi:hypothetical protein